MKLLQFFLPDKGIRVGLLEGEKVFDVTSKGVASVIELIDRACLYSGGFEEFLEDQFKDIRHTEPFPFEDLDVTPEGEKPHLMIPLWPPEVWGCGVTYKKSAEMRDEDTIGEKEVKGIYDYVYEGERPEIFFKATASRCVGPNRHIGIRRDSELTATEPELAYILGGGNEIVGYTVCNDVSAWDIERENPLYLPQSKIYAGCCALGPVLSTPSEVGDPYNLNIGCRIIRGGNMVFEGSVNSSLIKRRFDELTEYLTRDNPVPPGTVVSTGTGIIVPNDLPLKDGDVVQIEIESIGVLSNPVKQF